jgi:hypothetical protein
MPTDAVKLIETMQPFQAGDEAASTYLWFIHELWNADKHRTLALTAAKMIRGRVRLLAGDDTPLVEAAQTHGVTRDGDVVGELAMTDELLRRDDLKLEAAGDGFVALADYEG